MNKKGLITSSLVSAVLGLGYLSGKKNKKTNNLDKRKIKSKKSRKRNRK